MCVLSADGLTSSSENGLVIKMRQNCGNNSPSNNLGDEIDIETQPGGIRFVPLHKTVETSFMCTDVGLRRTSIISWGGKLISIVILFFILACNLKSEMHLTTPPYYNLNQPSVVKLPGYLDEISGLAYYPKDKSVFAISDERGWLYKIFLSGTMVINKWKFAKKADFEDVVLADSVFYVMKSTGDLLALRFHSPDSVEVKSYPCPAPGKNEFEILYLDKEQNRLIMLCKDCEADDKNSLTALAFDLSSLQFSPKPAYVIDIRKIETLLDEKKVRFKPSAAGIHPLTHRLFIVSSINKVVVVADQNGVPENVYKINPKLYKQPEGLTFTPEGHLLISNESKDIGAANILVFKYNPGR